MTILSENAIVTDPVENRPRKYMIYPAPRTGILSLVQHVSAAHTCPPDHMAPSSLLNIYRLEPIGRRSRGRNIDVDRWVWWSSSGLIASFALVSPQSILLFPVYSSVSDQASKGGSTHKNGKYVFNIEMGSKLQTSHESCGNWLTTEYTCREWRDRGHISIQNIAHGRGQILRC
jgi:hypothetical protein